MHKFSLGALVAAGLLAGGLTSGSASAADLGGDCCADLEERVAELEATTARKGNRKVSLTVSGWVGQQVMFWDDGVESNTYVTDLGTTLGSHFKFTGQAQISSEWSAGYVLHIEAISNDSLGVSQDVPNTGGSVLGNSAQLLQSYWFLKSERLGKLSVGQQSQASDNAAILVDGSGSLVPANWVAFDVNSFFIRDSAGNLTDVTWGAAGPCHGMGGAWGDCNGLTTNSVRYDTPVFGGFSASASWGEDDFWDVAIRYAGEFSGVKIAATAAYNQVTDAGMGAGNNETLSYFQAGLYLQHMPSGLFVLGNYGYLESEDFAEESETWYVKAGWRTRFNSLGHTVFYGEYLNNQADDLAGGLIKDPFAGFNATSSELDVWGLGVVQEIDAAAMSVWVKYRNLEYDDNSGVGYDDFHYVGAGALISF
ncbi:conserved exported protein of unknown function [Candidatus Filomicrobium marinum]|uniref:Porin domain-containing protein n=2 Tax=Filomicrobium TaxID=119044 RepID=A0A0D6JHV1_9HYPH|nr:MULTISPECIES: hypothetical protein [Filomicrobium]CFX40227.1 conserved exported protein of unknown function [Candidatus Filomicrobium marinum]CPR21320.1 conserved exported protein of unknown function [Candidatus Filomicrobium marinum]SDP26943.1 hypothetical protein SAMN04488061_2676 [Filomicrobium insigne]